MVNDLEKKYYKIREVSEILGFPASTLRYWEKQFSILTPRRNSSGTRFYTASDIEKLRMIIFLVKERGLKIEAAQEELRRNHDNISRRSQAITRLRSVRARLQDLLDSLHSLR